MADNEGAMGALWESVDNVSAVLLLKAHSNGKRATIHTSSISTGVGATQSIAADSEKARVQVNTEMARRPPDCSTIHPRIPIPEAHTIRV